MYKGHMDKDNGGAGKGGLNVEDGGRVGEGRVMGGKWEPL